MTLGEKICALRKGQGLTQNDLAGNEITRNMLSRIENGIALPSLSTLLYLAGRLGVPAGYLLDDEGEWLSYKKMEILPLLKKHFARKNYKEVLRTWEKHLGQTDDELALLLAESAVEYCFEQLYQGALKTISALLQKTKDFCKATVYPTTHIEAKAELLRAVVDNAQAPKFELDAALYSSLANDAVAEDFYLYLTESEREHSFQDSVLGEHMQAKMLIKQGKYRDAIKALEALEAQKVTANIGAFVLFRIYADLEHCHKQMRNFEEAYRYSVKRISLLSAFRA
ncbi:MAG: helix-turn-helix transcriptional regulator [Clostridia bacterium]|nr:helix-turn-helix transcriptional regulator [Clostridia bacterium]